MPVTLPLYDEDVKQSKPYDHELNPIAFALKRAFQLSPEQSPQVFNLTVQLGPHNFKMSQKVKNWVHYLDIHQEYQAPDFRITGGCVVQFNNFDKEPPRALVIDFPNRLIKFEGE